ncbi:hypothetical protein A9Q84_09160 [Halobacteriovorax marinus]|mgnify:CR=1 FL=1|uniref:OmpA-like domain-containing protein n=1 Tax=Halobacteriovorax marinus TaxID=97084 RepID=A0A1Y5F6J2_9BACT|nr:hypothetical protein A9Q84_09160 [Halobacteriovorax marinus]
MSQKIFPCLSLFTILLTCSPNQVLAKSQYATSNTKGLYAEFSNQIDAIKTLNKDLSPHDNTMKDIMLTQDQKNAVLKNIDKVLKDKNLQIFEYMKLTKTLKNKIDQFSFKERIQSEMQKRTLSDNIETSDQYVSELKGKIVEKDLRLQYLQKLLKNQNTILSQKIETLNGKIQKLSKTYSGLPEGFDPSMMKMQSHHHETLRRYQDKLHQNSVTITQFKNKFKGVKNYEQIIEENSSLASGLRKSQAELIQYKTAYAKLEKNYTAQVKKNQELESYAENIRYEYNNQITQLQEKYGEALAKVDNLEDRIMAPSIAKGGRFPASVPQDVEKANVSIQEKLNQQGLGHLVEIDPQHMKIILDERFQFESDSSEISGDALAKLKNVISVYSNEIFSNPKLRERLLKVQFIGHSSPFYKGTFVDPVSASKEAFNYNMYISLERANSLVNQIFSEDFGDFPYKLDIRSKMVISGKSFSEPLSVGRKLASIGPSQCGEYDCDSSQRVEIIFEFEKEAE